MKKIDIIFVLLFCGCVAYGINSYFSLPEAYWSTSSNECVMVIHDGVVIPCSELPEKYIRVWVK